MAKAQIPAKIANSIPFGFEYNVVILIFGSKNTKHKTTVVSEIIIAPNK